MHFSNKLLSGIAFIGVAGISGYYVFSKYMKPSSDYELQNIKKELEDDTDNQCFEADTFNKKLQLQLKSIEELYEDAVVENQALREFHSKQGLTIEKIKIMSLEEIQQDPSLWAPYVRGWEDRTADVHLNPSPTSPRKILTPQALRQSHKDEQTAGCKPKPDEPKLGPATTSSRIPELAQRKKSTQQIIRKKKRDAARMAEFLAKKRAEQGGQPPPLNGTGSKPVQPARCPSMTAMILPSNDMS